jgi:hypothetical protein
MSVIRTMALLLAALGLAGCGYTSTSSVSGTGISTVGDVGHLELGPPPATLLLDCQGPHLGTTVQLRHIPTATELDDLKRLEGLERIIVDLVLWPDSYGQIQSLEQAPVGVDLVAVLPGYPPSQAHVEVWNLLQTKVRVIVVAGGPLPGREGVADLNRMRGLERLVVWTQDPGAFRMERLAVPVSLRVMR